MLTTSQGVFGLKSNKANAHDIVGGFFEIQKARDAQIHEGDRGKF